MTSKRAEASHGVPNDILMTTITIPSAVPMIKKEEVEDKQDEDIEMMAKEPSMALFMSMISTMTSLPAMPIPMQTQMMESRAPVM